MSFFNFILVLVIATTAPTLVLSELQYWCSAAYSCPGNLCCMYNPSAGGMLCSTPPTTCSSESDCCNGECCNGGKCGSCNCWNAPGNCNADQCCLAGRCAQKTQAGGLCDSPQPSAINKMRCECANGLNCQRDDSGYYAPYICSSCNSTCDALSTTSCCKNGQCLKIPQPGEECTENICPCAGNLECAGNGSGVRTCQGDGQGTCTIDANCGSSNCCSNGKCLRRPTENEFCKPSSSLLPTDGSKPANDCACASGLVCRRVSLFSKDFTCKKPLLG